MEGTIKTEVAIIGAGPTGLSLAIVRGLQQMFDEPLLPQRLIRKEQQIELEVLDPPL
jgi:thioredoxin reductase